MSSKEVNRLRPLLDDMLCNCHLYLLEDIEQMAIQYRSAILCEEIDLAVISEIVNIHNQAVEGKNNE